MVKKTKVVKKLKTLDMELALADYFDFRQSLIVPNISWGLHIHECDMLVLTKAGYAYEIEIKVSLSDLKNDAKKQHKHQSKLISKLYFAIPEHLEKNIEHIPDKAGIIIVKKHPRNGRVFCVKLRESTITTKYKFDDAQRYQMARLGTMRIWSLKKSIKKLKKV